MANDEPQGQPPVPPPPAVPPVPPAPRYGEYAPGFVPGQTPAPAPEAAPAAPAPQYGYGYGAPAADAAPVRKRRTWDFVLTIILLIVGFFGAAIGVLYGVIFLFPDLLDQVFSDAYGLDGFNGDIGSAPLILIVSHSILYLVTVGLSIFMLVKKFITFWVPLAAGVLAAIIFWATVVAVFLSDPAFMTLTPGNTTF